MNNSAQKAYAAQQASLEEKTPGWEKLSQELQQIHRVSINEMEIFGIYDL